MRVRAITTNAFDPDQRIDQHVQVDVPANSQVLRVRYRDTVPETAQRRRRLRQGLPGLPPRRGPRQAKASLLEDVARLNQQIAAAEKVIRSPGPAPATARPPQARLTPLNNRLQPLNVQLNGFLSLDFTPGTVIAEAGLPSRPAPTAASNRHQPARRLFLGGVRGFVRDRTDDRLRGREDLPSAWTGRSWPPSRPWPGGSARTGCAGGAGPGTAWSPGAAQQSGRRVLPVPADPDGRLANQLDITSVMAVSAGGRARAPPRPTWPSSWPRPARTCCWSRPTCAGPRRLLSKSLVKGPTLPVSGAGDCPHARDN